MMVLGRRATAQHHSRTGDRDTGKGHREQGERVRFGDSWMGEWRRGTLRRQVMVLREGDNEEGTVGGGSPQGGRKLGPRQVEESRAEH